MLTTPISVSTCNPYMDRPPVAIYVHGLASGDSATTFDKLAENFSQFVWFSADFGDEYTIQEAISGSTEKIDGIGNKWILVE